MAQSGSVSVLGTEGRVFKSHFPVKVIIFNSLKNKNFIKMNTKIIVSARMKMKVWVKTLENFLSSSVDTISRKRR